MRFMRIWLGTIAPVYLVLAGMQMARGNWPLATADLLIVSLAFGWWLAL